MALSADKIIKLRELAERGIDGEKSNAIDILTKNGISWKKPKESVINTIKKSVGLNIRNEYSIKVLKAADILLVAVVLETLSIKEHNLSISGKFATFICTKAQSEEIGNMFYKNRDKFNSDVISYALTKVLLK